jgi:ABC-type multidrug transport system ATPase subunit/ABC-type multidrug transport system permease subunit
MGPSGSGKSTLLSVLAHRPFAAKFSVEGQTLIDRAEASNTTFRRASCFVEQEDSLIGSLTARETLDFAAKLGLPNTVTKAERERRVDGLLTSLGLLRSADTIIGTAIRKGLSGGEKRRVSVASQLITCPKILFLDEPTSGLDSVASFEVISYLREVAKKSGVRITSSEFAPAAMLKCKQIIVIASIHQPSTTTFNLFDKVFLLSQGKLCYGGPVAIIGQYLESIGHPMPLHMNPAEYMLDLVNVDFAANRAESGQQLARITDLWGEKARRPQESSTAAASLDPMASPVSLPPLTKRSQLLIPVTLLHRNWIKSRRDVIMYGIRVAMYLGLAIMMGSVWLRLQSRQEYIQPFINALFFGSAFMSFMAVAYVPAFLEDHSTFIKERANGLYGPISFLVANFFIGLPWLFLISVLFSVITYWLCNFRPDASAFFTFIMWLFLDLVAAESLVVFVTSIFPVFVVALALTAFANGLWMSVGGFLVNPTVLNVFWKYWARYIDYQSYVFQGMMVNEFSQRVFDCSPAGFGSPTECMCMYPSSLQDQCRIDGRVILQSYGYHEGRTGLWVGILLCIVLGYRFLTLAVLILRKT